MVNGVSSYNYYNPYPAARAAAGAVVINQNDIENLIKYANGQPITTIPEPTIAQTAIGTLPFAGIFGGFQAIGALKNNGLTGTEKEAFKAAKKAGTAKGWNISETIKNVKAQYPYTRTDAIKAGSDFFKKEYGDILKSKTTPNEARLPFKMGKMMDKLPGYARLRETGFGKAMGRSGAGFMAVIDGLIKTTTDVVPAFQQLGFKSGMKQIGKSATEVAIGSVGWLAGDALGMSVGAAIGTAICPGVGTAIGGFLGRFIGGAVAGAAAAKAAKAITGKTEIEKAQEKATQEAAAQIQNDENTKLALAQQTLEQAQAALAQNPNDADAIAARDAAAKIITEYQTAEAQKIEQQSEQTTTQPAFNGYNQSFKGLFAGIPTVPGFNGVSYDMNIFRETMSHRTI